MITFALADQIERELCQDEVEGFFESTLAAAFVPTDGNDPAYFALSTPAQDGSVFVERLRSINEWFIEGTGRVPDALLVNPQIKKIIADQAGLRHTPPCIFLPLKHLGIPPNTPAHVQHGALPIPGVVLLAHENVPYNLIGHVVDIDGEGSLDSSYQLGGITVLTSPQVLSDAVS